MKVVFMGTPEFSVPVLESLVKAGRDVVAAYTQPPRAAGRGQKGRISPVHRTATALGIPARHPISLRDDKAQAALAALKPDVVVVVAYGLILPQPVLDIPALGCLNIHASLLPRWRGAAPIHRSVMAGDIETGVCIMQMEAGLDTGPVLLRTTTQIGPEDTAGDLHDRLSAIGADLIGEALTGLAGLVPEPQPDEGVTYAEKIAKSEAWIDWTQPAGTIDRQIRGLSPWPGAWTTLEGRRLKLLRCRLSEGHGAPGEVLRGLTVACGSGAIDITEVQAEGRGRQSSDEFLRGNPVSPGAVLGG